MEMSGIPTLCSFGCYNISVNILSFRTDQRPLAVLFDCGGVVVDSEPLMNAMLKVDFARFDLMVDDDGLEKMLGGVLSDVARRATAMGAAPGRLGR